jgi:hypothetical protein
MRLVRFWLGNLVVAYLLVFLLGDSLQYPLWVPVPFRPEILAMMMGVSFSLLGTLFHRVLPNGTLARILTIGVVTLLAVALAGALCGALSPGNLLVAGSVIALATFAQSPLLAIPTFLWALAWTYFNFPPVQAAPSSRVDPRRKHLAAAAPAGDWIGSTR